MTIKEFSAQACAIAGNGYSVSVRVDMWKHTHYDHTSDPEYVIALCPAPNGEDCEQYKGDSPQAALKKLREELHPTTDTDDTDDMEIETWDEKAQQLADYNTARGIGHR